MVDKISPTVSFSFLAASTDGSFVYAITGGSPGKLSVIQTSDNKVIDTLTLPDPAGVAVSSDGEFVYVTNSTGNSVSVVDTANNMVIDTIAVGDGPQGVAADPDNVSLFVVNNGKLNTNGTVSVISISGSPPLLTYMVVETIMVGIFPQSIALSPNGDVVYVTNTGPEFADKGSISVLEGSMNKTIELDDIPIAIAASPDGQFVYTGNESSTVSVIQTSDDTVAHNVNISSGAFDVAVTPDSKFVYVTTGDGKINVIDTSDNSVTTPVDLGSDAIPEGIVIISTSGLDPMGNGNGSNSCAISGPGAASSYAPILLFIPALILIRRLLRRTHA